MAMFALVQIFGEQQMAEAVLQVAGTVVACVGLAMQKNAQSDVLQALHDADGLRSAVNKPSWRTLLRSWKWWAGVLMVLCHSPLDMFSAAISSTPITLTMFSPYVVVVSFMLSYVFLQEGYSRREVVAGFACSAAALTLGHATFRLHSTIPTLEKSLAMYGDLSTSVGFAAFVTSGGVVTKALVYVSHGVSMDSPLVHPLLAGFFLSQYRLFAQLPYHVLFESSFRFYSAVGFSCIVGVLSVFFILMGNKHLASRFFIPATYLSTMTCSVLQDWFFMPRQYALPTDDVLLLLFPMATFALGLCQLRPFSARLANEAGDVTSLRARLLTPFSVAAGVLYGHRKFLAIFSDHLPNAQATPSQLAPVSPMGPSSSTRSWYPFAACVLLIGFPVFLFSSGYVLLSLWLLTACVTFMAWKFSMHVALFGFIGLRNIRAYSGADFQAVHDAEGAHLEDAAANPNPANGPTFAWQDVAHFVMLPITTEDLQVLRVTLQSLAQSTVAKSSVIVVLAMEDVEQSFERAEALISEFRENFVEMTATFHQPGLSRGANVRWAAGRICEEFLPARGIDIGRCILTVADAEGDINKQYLGALTYHFLHSGTEEADDVEVGNHISQRYRTIWQPPVLLYKNFHAQAAIVRLFSMVVSLYQLANLADPYATRLPSSTYSLSARLAQEVNGWDADTFAESWRMYLKCFLLTRGYLKVVPIFCPVWVCAPVCDTTYKALEALWLRTKRFALCIELAYFQELLPGVAMSIPGSRERITFIWEAMCILFKMATLHLVLSCAVVLALLNALLILYLSNSGVMEAVTLTSSTAVTNIVFLSLGAVAILVMCRLSAVVYKMRS